MAAGFPIAVGTGPTASSSRSYPKFDVYQSLPASNDDLNQNADVIMAMGNNDDDSLVATVFIGYHYVPSEIERFHDKHAHTSEGELRSHTLHDTAPHTPLASDEQYTPGNHDDSVPRDITSSTIKSPSPIISGPETFNVIAELRVQISAATAPFVSTAYAMTSREKKFKVPMGKMRKIEQTRSTIGESCDSPDKRSLRYRPSASLVFSSNESYLACIIPFPTGYEPILSAPNLLSYSQNSSAAMTIVVIFSIQTLPFSSHQKILSQKLTLPPLPEYVFDKVIDRICDPIAEEKNNNASDGNWSNYHTNDDETIDGGNSNIKSENAPERVLWNRNHRRRFDSYVAHQPKIVRFSHKFFYDESFPSAAQHRSVFAHNHPMHSATSLCDIPVDHLRGQSSSAKSMLLVGTVCGSLLLINYSLAQAQSMLLSCSQGEPIVHVAQCPPATWKPLDIYGEEQGSISEGRLSLVGRNGTVVIYTTYFLKALDGVSELIPSTSYVLDGGISKEDNISVINGAVTAKSKHLKLKVEELFLCRSLLYIRAKWLSPSLLALLTRQPHFLTTKDASSESSGIVAAQVWSIEIEKGSAIPHVVDSFSRAELALVSELKLSLSDGDHETDSVHGRFSIQMGMSCQKPSIHDVTIMQNTSLLVDYDRAMFMSHHRTTDCLSISTQVVTTINNSSRWQLQVKLLCLIWDWKSNVTGLNFSSNALCCSQPVGRMPSLFSRLYVSEDCASGLSAILLYENMLADGKNRRIQKDIFRLGVLSPHHDCRDNEFLRVHEPSNLLLMPDSVMFPSVVDSSMSRDAFLRWEESNIPSNYLCNGPCRLAAIGAEGRAIAVAASRGLCLLDLTRRESYERSETNVNIAVGRRMSFKYPLSPTFPVDGPRWKLFSNTNEEQGFRVHQMVWWERSTSDVNEHVRYGHSEDILVAVIQYSHNDAFHLVCWSRRRLGFGEDQLIVQSNPVKDVMNQDLNTSRFGLAIPGSKLHSLSLLSDPSDDAQRSLILVTFDSLIRTGCSHIKYAIFQLQAASVKTGKTVILSRLSRTGSIPIDCHSMTGIFLASGTFSFELETQEGDPVTVDSENQTVAFLGVTTLFDGLVVVCLRTSDHVLYRPLLLRNNNDSSEPKHRYLIVSFSRADVYSDDYGCRIVWNFVRNDGSFYSWSVPCGESLNEGMVGVDLIHHEIGFERHTSIGEICYLGHSSWWLGGTSMNESIISLGPYSCLHGCSLFSGQQSKKIVGNNVATWNTSFQVSGFTFGPPSVTSMLYISFLSLAERTKNHVPSQIDCPLRDGYYEFFKRCARCKLRRGLLLGSIFSSLRVIVFKIIDLLKGGDCSNDPEKILESGKIGKLILSEMVSAMKEEWDVLTFTSFFLSVGRQLEPHQFDLIFPLPAESEKTNMTTTEDFFLISCAQGSLSTALQALPLFSSHIVSHSRVVQLVYHCLARIKESFDSCRAHVSEEEEKYLHQLFWFGVKLEDAIEELEYDHISECISEDSSSCSSSEISGVKSEDNECSIYDDSDKIPPYGAPLKGEPQRGIVLKIVSNLFPSLNTRRVSDFKEDEDAIHDAASVFIVSDFDSPKKSHLTTPVLVRRDIERSMHVFEGQRNKYSSSECEESSGATVAGAVSIFINHVLGLHGDVYCSSSSLDGAYLGWRAVYMVSQLLQGDRETSAITSAASCNALRITQTLTIKVAHCSQDGDDTAHELILHYLQRLVLDCGAQIKPDSAGVVFNLILLLFLRYNSSDIKGFRTTLIIVGIVTGHVSGRIAELIDLSSGTSQIQNIYCALAKRLE